MKESIVTFKAFQGINNVKNPWELKPDELVTATDVDITEPQRLRVRVGRTAIDSGYSNMWANQYVWLAVKNGNLISRRRDGSEKILREGVGIGEMSYAAVNDIVAYNNGTITGYVQNEESLLFPDPDDDFKLPLPVGNLIEHFNNRLYIIIGSVFFWSDILSQRFGCIDKRRNGKQMPSPIMLFKAVDDGIYISDERAIYFARGLDAEDWTQPQGLQRVLPYPAKYNAWCEIDGHLLNFGVPITGKTYAITTNRGICIATNGGFITNVTEKYYAMPTLGAKVAMIFRQQNNMNQVITVIAN